MTKWTERLSNGYGYVQTDKSLGSEAEAIRLVRRFVEKPDANTAQTYLNEGGYYWNAGTAKCIVHGAGMTASTKVVASR